MNQEQRFPLFWPSGWPRATGFRPDSRFSRPVRYAARWHSMSEATDHLAGELQRMGAKLPVLSTNVEIRLDGQPYSGRAAPQDPGAAVYFTLKSKRVVLACDKWRRVECNVWAIAQHVGALRAQERWGVGSVEQAFAGYVALTDDKHKRNWWEVLGTPREMATSAVIDGYRALAKKYHPDAGGDPARMAEINVAFADFKLERGIA